MKLFSAGSGSKIRINHTRLLVVCVFLLLVTCKGSWAGSGIWDGLFKFAGLGCVTISAFGRAWASLYISGYKLDSLIESGPYSVTRNPLYLFSLIGVIGMGLGSESFLVLALLVVLFGFYYPSIIIQEEKVLEERHGASFTAYAGRVPKFFPKMSLYSEPDTYLVNTKKYRKSLVDATYFIWIYGALLLIEKMHESGILPTLINLP
jgi:protein-S-isoprenylcysteine O-methyltransferase Ste14